MKKSGVGSVVSIPGIVLAVVVACLSACIDGLPRAGEVARINGRSITFAQLEAMRDTAFMPLEPDSSDAFEKLRSEYGYALAELLLLELVKQQLERKKQSVTAEELAAEEALIRADYPAGAFERKVAEDAVSLETWRFLLCNRLSLQKFQQTVLRQNISIGSEEVEEYYRGHMAEFIRPAWISFIMLSGEKREAVEEAHGRLMETGDPVLVQKEMPAVGVRFVRIGKNRLPPSVIAVLSQLQPGQFSAVSPGDEGFRAVLFLEEGPEHRLSPTEAYPVIEKTLLEARLQESMTDWAAKRLPKANIRVSSLFLNGKGI